MIVPHPVTACVMESMAPLLFALIDDKSPYWAFGFPAAALSVFGADLCVFRLFTG
jgi:hypothetical protein